MQRLTQCSIAFYDDPSICASRKVPSQFKETCQRQASSINLTWLNRAESQLIDCLFQLSSRAHENSCLFVVSNLHSFQPFAKAIIAHLLLENLHAQFEWKATYSIWLMTLLAIQLPLLLSLSLLTGIFGTQEIFTTISFVIRRFVLQIFTNSDFALVQLFTR